MSDVWSHLTRWYILTRWCLDSLMNDLYASLRSSHQFFSHWSDELSLLQVLLLLIDQLIDWSSWSDSLIRWDIAACDHRDVQCHSEIREIRIILDDELRFRFIWVNILSNSMLLDQLLKLFYSQMIILWGQHDHEEIRSLFVHNWRDDIVLYEIVLWDIRMRFIQSFYIWQKFLFFLMNCYLNFLMKTCCDRLSLIYWLMLLLLLLKRKFYWLLASDVSGS